MKSWLVLAAIVSLSSLGWQRNDVRWYQGPTNLTANKEHFDPEGLTYASSDDPFNTITTVYWKGNYVNVRCNDRGPNQTELTRGAFRHLEPLKTGVLKGASVYKHNDSEHITVGIDGRED